MQRPPARPRLRRVPSAFRLRPATIEAMSFFASRRGLWLLLVGGSLGLGLIISTDVTPILRGPSPETPVWYWPYALAPAARWWAPLAAAGWLFLVGAWWLRPAHATWRRTILALSGLMLGHVLLQAAFLYARGGDAWAEAINRTLADNSNGYFRTAAEVTDMGALLRAYPAAMGGFSAEHARTHPPGLIVLNWLTIRAWEQAPDLAGNVSRLVWPARCADLWLFERPISVAAALLIWAGLPMGAGALTIWPIYALARRWQTGPAARLAALLAAATPGLMLFSPQSDQLFACLAAWVVYLIWPAGARGRAMRRLLAGLLIGLASFMSLGNAIWLGLAGLILVLGLRLADRMTMRDGLREVIPALVWLSLGAALPWLAYWAGWGVSPWRMAHSGLNQHYLLVNQYRAYDTWLLFNLFDGLVFAGWPVCLGWIAAAWRARRPGRRSEDSLALALLVFVLGLDLSGTTRGEVGRLWLFLWPLAALAAGLWWGRRLTSGRRLALLALQLSLCLAVGIAWRPLEAQIVSPAHPIMPPAAVTAWNGADLFGGALRLTGYQRTPGALRAGDTLDITLTWQPVAPVTRPYTIFAQLLDDQNQILAQRDSWPVDGRWPPTCWSRGEEVVDRRQIVLPSRAMPGNYRLAVGWYDSLIGTRLTLPDGRDALILDMVEVAP